MRENRTSRPEATAPESVSLVRTLPTMTSPATTSLATQSPLPARTSPSANASSAEQMARNPRKPRTGRSHKPRATPRVKASAAARSKDTTAVLNKKKITPRAKARTTPHQRVSWLHRTWTRLVTVLRPWVRPALRLAAERRLQLIEMQQLGDKRFLAIARVGEQTYLIGGGTTNIVLLAELDRTVRPLATPRELSTEAS